MHEQVAQDTPVHRATIDEIPLEKAEQMLEALRERRMLAFQVYADLQVAKSQSRNDATIAAYNKRLAIMAKKLASADKAMEAFEDQINKARALLVQYEDELTNEQQFRDSQGVR